MNVPSPKPPSVPAPMEDLLPDVNQGDGEQLKEMVNNYYKKLFRISGKWQTWYQTQISYPSLEEVDIVNLDMHVMNEEIKRALFDIKSWKAPSPYGFPTGFYQKSWDNVGKN
ncbi:hypothetical protein KIW84_034386 [Lathyrus oleraceus]|uniref:Uncharacterized protein n=1 Tax=Pisum sativum TaxID=3888 RepID=A0A9D5B4G8_PEA|nr:hypothetical protein KIW84_034386 [Pisum sativum]